MLLHTGLRDKNGELIKIGDKVKLILEDGEERIFDVRLKTVQRIVKSHPDFDEEFAKVSITGVVFSWEGYDLFPCVDGDGVPDNEKMEIVKSVDVKGQIRIFQLDEYSWYAAHSIMEFLNWYHENVDSIEIPEDIAGITMIEPEDGSMWSNTNITQEDIDKLGDYDEHCGGGIGDLKRMSDGEIYKMQTFADVLGGEDIKEPYEIASTEW